jgi:hypothetical protein
MAAAFCFAKQAKGEDELENSMGCALFCALSLEATLNYMGDNIFPAWEKYFQKKLSPEGKLVLIANQFGFQVNFGEPPFQAFRAVFELRNQLAHGRTHDLSYETAKHWLEFGEHRWPAAQWEPLCTDVNANAIYQDTEKIIDLLHEVTRVEEIPAFLLSEHVDQAGNSE